MLNVIPQYCIAHPYCARFTRHLVRANELVVERVHIRDIRDFPQSKLGREINARF